MPEDKDAHKAYDRKGMYGVKEKLVHEKAHKFSLYSKGFRDKLNKKRIIQRRGDIPRDGGRAIKVSEAQARAYEAICQSLDPLETDSIKCEILIQAGIRQATIKSLERQKLITITEDDRVCIWLSPESDQEIMSRGGVGKLVISIGVK